MYQISNLGLNMPGQNKPIGYWNSVSTGFGFGERSEAITGERVTNPGPGTYFKEKIDKQMEGENYCAHRKSMDDNIVKEGPTWK